MFATADDRTHRVPVCAAKVQLISQRHMLVIQRQRGVGIYQTEHGLIEAKHSELIAVVATDELNLVDTNFCVGTGGPCSRASKTV